MHKVRDEHDELADLLRAFDRRAPERYIRAPWLQNAFDEPVWTVDLGSALKIDWRVAVGRLGSLVDPANVTLWTTFRSWLILQTHTDLTGGRPMRLNAARLALKRVLISIDYFLLHADALLLDRAGFAALTTNDLKALIATYASSSHYLISIYAWPHRLATYLRQHCAELSDRQIAETIVQQPLIDIPPAEGGRLTGLSDDELRRARAWLYRQRLYKSGRDTSYRWSPRLRGVVASIYSNTVWARHARFLLPHELCLGPDHAFQREYPRTPVRESTDPRMSRHELLPFVATLDSLRLLQAQGLTVPPLDALTRELGLSLKELGRVRTLPYDGVMAVLQSAITLVMTQGKALVDSYLALARAAVECRQSIAMFLHNHDIGPYLTESVQQWGVCCWTIRPQRTGLPQRRYKTPKAHYFAQLRQNAGLWDALRVLYGAIALILGLLMARRQGELLDLVAGDCLDATRTRLVFRNRKSGFQEYREREARPIPSVAVEMILLLEYLQTELIAMGALKAYTYLFAAPARSGPALLCQGGHAHHYNETLDLLCDWAQSPRDHSGARCYIRQHQLRRFFAMLFFWGAGFGGMDVLRWFLGHTDAQHLWHYITEATPGQTLRSVAAEWVAYSVVHANPASERLAAAVAQHFGTADFSIIETPVLLDYLEGLLADGQLVVEPQFLDHGRRYRIAVVLTPR